MINPIWLNTFCTLVQIGHFTRTAETLHMTQSGVSQHVKKLEEYLGKALLMREGKTFTLTDAGRQLIHKGKPLLSALAQLELTIADDPPYEGLVRVMSPGSVGLKLYPALLALQQQHPKLMIDYRFAPNVEIERAMLDGDIDIGLMTHAASKVNLTSSPIGSEALRLVTPANINNPDWQTLMTLGFIDHPDGAFHAQQLLAPNFQEFDHYNALPNRGFCNQISLILDPVASGLGFTVLPAFAVEAFARPDEINVVSLDASVEETLFSIAHRHRTHPNRVSTVFDTIRSVL